MKLNRFHHNYRCAFSILEATARFEQFPVPRSAIKPRNVGINVTSAAGSKRKASAQVRQGSAGKKKGKQHYKFHASFHVIFYLISKNLELYILKEWP